MANIAGGFAARHRGPCRGQSRLHRAESPTIATTPLGLSSPPHYPTRRSTKHRDNDRQPPGRQRRSMAGEDRTETDSTDIQARVLRTTLTEICESRQTGQDGGLMTDCCVICLDEISDGSTAQPCGHSNFDYLCLLSWLERRPTCPLCKATVAEVCRGDKSSPSEVFTVATQTEADSGSAGVGDVTERRRSGASSAQRTFQHYFLGQHHDRRRGRSSWTPRRPPTGNEALARRRHVYRHQLYSLHVGSNRISRYRDLTPQLFVSDATLVSRARMFMRRELQVFTFLDATTPSPPPPPSGSRSSPTVMSRHDQGHEVDRRRNHRAANAEFLLEYAVAILKTVDMQGSAGQATELLGEFLGRDSAQLFLHELRSWLRSPYGTLEAWDRAVQYKEPGQRSKPDEDEQEVEAPGQQGRRPQPDHESRDTTHRRPRGDYWRPSKRKQPLESSSQTEHGSSERRIRRERSR
jgi:hypothetical protein